MGLFGCPAFFVTPRSNNMGRTGKTVRLFCIWVVADGFSVIKLGSKPLCCSNLGRRMDSTFTARLLSTTIGVRDYLSIY